MGSALTLELPYDQLLLLAMGLFMFIGAMRGWYREFVSTCVLGVLTAILIKPELAAPIINYLSKLVRLVVAFVQGRGTVDLRQLMATYEGIQIPFDGQNPYMLLVFVLVGFVVLSYGTRSGAKDLSALSRILGGLMGLLNGYLVISLFKEYVVRYLQKRTPTVAASGLPPQVSVAVSGLPQQDLLRGQGFQVALGLLAVIVVVVLVSNATGRPLGKR